MINTDSVIGEIETRNKIKREYCDVKTFKDFELSLNEIKIVVLKVKKEVISNKGYKILYSGHTVTNEHSLISSQYTSKIKFYLCKYANGKDKFGNIKYIWRWCLISDIDVHHIDGNKQNNLGGNLEKLTQELHETLHNLKVFLDRKQITKNQYEDIVMSLKHNDISIDEIPNIIKDLRGF
jgi:hypothetical protein